MRSAIPVLWARIPNARWLRADVTPKPEPGAFVFIPVLRASDDRLRLESRPIAPAGTILWNDKTDGMLNDVFDWQNGTGEEVASQTFAALIAHISSHLAAKDQPNLAAEELIVKVITGAKSNVETPPMLLESTKMAIRKNPELGIAYEIGVAFIAMTGSIGYHALADKYAPFMKEWSERAAALTTGASSSCGAIAFSSFIPQGDIAATRADLLGILRDLPFDLETLSFVGFLFNYPGRLDEASEALAIHDGLIHGSVSRGCRR